jgi:N-acetylglucosamine-6-phosphate deacetylase
VTQLVSAGRIVTPKDVHVPGWVLVEGGRVASVGAGTPPRAPDVFLPEATLAPGFVDIHVHGGGGASFGSDPARVVDTHLSLGTTTMVASLVTAPLEDLSTDIRELGRSGLVAGVHAEGPWLSPLHAGAHDPALLRAPTPADVETLLEAGNGALRMVTVAPELPGALDAVKRLVEAGVVAAIGHTDATYDQTRAALDVGATAVTHLYNAMRSPHHREPGPVAALLEHPDVRVELIADGLHLHPATLRLALRAVGARAVLVTDAMAAAGCGDGDYFLGGRSVEVRRGVARLSCTGPIAGSTVTLAGAVRFAVQEAGMALQDAVRAASSTPAALLGLGAVGALQQGFAADLVALSADLKVVAVMKSGSWVGGRRPRQGTGPEGEW